MYRYRSMDLDAASRTTRSHVAGFKRISNGQHQPLRIVHPEGSCDCVRAHGATVLDVELGRDGRHVATGRASTGRPGPGTWRAEYSADRDAPRPQEAGRQCLVRQAGSRLAIQVCLGTRRPGSGDVSLADRGEVLTLPSRETTSTAAIPLTQDKRRLEAASGPEGTVRVWSTATGKELLLLDRDARTSAPVRAVIGVDVSPDGSRIATAGSGRQRADRGCRVRPAAGSHPRTSLSGRRLCRVKRAVFSPTARNPIDGSDATVRIFDTASPSPLRCSAGTRRAASGRTGGWSQDGARLLSMATDGTRIWDARTGRQLLQPCRPSEAPEPPPSGAQTGPQVLLSRVLAQTSGTRRTVSGYARWRRALRRPTWSSAATGRASPKRGLTKGFRAPALGTRPRAGVETLRLRDSGVACRAQPGRPAGHDAPHETARAVRARLGARPRALASDRAEPRHPLADRRGVPTLPPALLRRRLMRGRADGTTHRPTPPTGCPPPVDVRMTLGLVAARSRTPTSPYRAHARARMTDGSRVLPPPRDVRECGAWVLRRLSMAG